MGLPAFPDRAFSPGGTKAYNPARSQNGIMTGVYGTNASDGVAYNIADVNNTMRIQTVKLTAIAQKAIDEKVRRGGGNILLPAGYYEGKISAPRIQDIRTQLEIRGPAATQAYMGAGAGTNSSDGFTATGSSTSTGITGYDSYYGAAIYGPVTTTTYGVLPDPTPTTFPQAAAPTMSYSFTKDDIIYAADINKLIKEINDAGAVCLCNCNYCTCNCNYCTCNCNYACTCNCNYSDERVKTQIEYM
jgi:hypothetical protein